MRPPTAWPRIVLALLFASTTVIGLAAPTGAKGVVGHGIAVHHTADELPCHGRDQAPDPKIDTAAHLSCLGCVIHCVGMATLDEGLALSHPQPWRGDVTAVEDGNGIEAARLDRPPDLRL